MREDITVFMNTWANYNEYGADSGITPTGWMDVDEARDYIEEYAEYEPFINDVDNCPFEVSEYDNASSVLDKIERYNDLDDYDKMIFENVCEITMDEEEAFDIVEKGDYHFIQDVSNDEDLGYAYIEEVYGGLENMDADFIADHLDFEQLGRDLGFDNYTDNFTEGERQELYEKGEISDPDYVNAGYYWCGDEDASDYDIGEAYFDAVGGEISNPGAYFDYRDFGRELGWDYTFTNDGAVVLY